MWPALRRRQDQDWRKRSYHCAMADLPIDLDRTASTPLAMQIPYW
jgi:hypothetical protein